MVGREFYSCDPVQFNVVLSSLQECLSYVYRGSIVVFLGE